MCLGAKHENIFLAHLWVFRLTVDDRKSILEKFRSDMGPVEFYALFDTTDRFGQNSLLFLVEIKKGSHFSSDPSKSVAEPKWSKIEEFHDENFFFDSNCVLSWY